MKSSLKPARRRVFEDVCDDIRRQIAMGRLQPGDKLAAERELAERLNVSRAAVREALRALEASGVLEFRKGVYGGAFIRDPSSSGIRDSISDMLALGNISLVHLSEVRSTLLTLAAGAAAERADATHFDLIEENIERTARLYDAGAHDSLMNAIVEFYVLLGDASGNGILKILIEAVTDVARELLLRQPTEDAGAVAGARRKILAALRAGDKRRAMKLVSDHMADLHQYLASHGGDAILEEEFGGKHLVDLTSRTSQAS